MICVFTIISLLRGNGTESPIDAKRCDMTDWMLIYILMAFCIIFEIIGIWVIRSEYKKKVESRYEFTKGEIRGTAKEVVSFCFLISFTSILVTFCGASPSGMVIPVLVFVGVDPRVAIATANFIGTLNTLTASILLIFFKKIRLDYSLYI